MGNCAQELVILLRSVVSALARDESIEVISTIIVWLCNQRWPTVFCAPLIAVSVAESTGAIGLPTTVAAAESPKLARSKLVLNPASRRKAPVLKAAYRLSERRIKLFKTSFLRFCLAVSLVSDEFGGGVTFFT